MTKKKIRRSNLNLNRSPSRRCRLEGWAGRGGVRVTWDDGTITTYAAGARLSNPSSWSRQPVRVEGRMLRTASRGGLGYEAPALHPLP
ncbi:MAG TPA: hypothetical protein VFB50_23235 [Chloroflexota bacterium]|nr:hypothetical protein [Chloroflexota bacterium]